MPKVIVLHSGGLDSTVCVMQALELGHEVMSLGIDYKQRHGVELAYAALQAERLGIRRRVLSVAWDKLEREIPLDRSIDEMAGGSTAFLAGRNLVFLALAAAQAATEGASEIWIGVNAVDYSGYPDCRPEFVDSFQETVELAIPGGANVVAPLIDLTKPEIAAEARRLGLEHGDTWSCYRPQVESGAIRICGRCDACILHDHAWSAIVEG